jgi:hypothetical protein
MSHCKLRTPWPIHFKLLTVIGIDSLMVCILFGEISIFHSRVMRLNYYSVLFQHKLQISASFNNLIKSDLSFAPHYWYDAVWEIWGNSHYEWRYVMNIYKQLRQRSHDMPVVNIHTIFVKTFFPITLEWKI